MKKMIYIVECYFGQYDTAYQFIDSIFDDASAAKKKKENYRDVLQEIT